MIFNTWLGSRLDILCCLNVSRCIFVSDFVCLRVLRPFRSGSCLIVFGVRLMLFCLKCVFVDVFQFFGLWLMVGFLNALRCVFSEAV